MVKEKEQRDKEREQYRVKLWAYIAKKEVPKMAKMFAQARHTMLINNKKVCSSSPCYAVVLVIKLCKL